MFSSISLHKISKIITMIQLPFFQSAKTHLAQAAKDLTTGGSQAALTARHNVRTEASEF
jgi:hypothetical protein